MTSYNIERLLNYAIEKNLISQFDICYSRNLLLELFKQDQPYKFKEGETINEKLENPTEILSSLLDDAYKFGLIEQNTISYRELFDTKIMGLLTPSPKEINQTFNELYQINKVSATDYFYNISKNSNYIRTYDIAKNLYWKAQTNFGELEITINLSKPEKDPADIARAKLLPQTNYPTCFLCKENEGFAGTLNHPARQNLRLIETKLSGKKWFMQYSPYVYYNEHCIVLDGEHSPMKTTKETFKRLLDFVTFLPHYFIGSNADIPIVGGSILTHDHYQGGKHKFPMEKAKAFANYKSEKYPEINISLVKWAMSVIRISGTNKEKLTDFAFEIMELWKTYSDETADIIAFTGKTPHNAVTPIARKNENGEFEFDLVLRNNRTSPQHPMGIFHPHEELHHIKKENIGLIEVMGLAVLPGRLSSQMQQIAPFLTGEKDFDKSNLGELAIFAPWIKELLEKYGNNNIDPIEIIKKEIGEIFKKVLQDAGVFKYNDNGRKQFGSFMELFSKNTDQDNFI